MNKSRHFFEKTDLTAIFLVLAVCCVGILFLTHYRSDAGSAAYAEIRVNSRLYDTIDLKKVTAPYSLTVKGNFSVTLEISSDGVRFISSECPDKLCVHSGLLTAGSSAACLPAGVSVTVKGNGTRSVDGIVG